jgi:L-aspartate oxidase
MTADLSDPNHVKPVVDRVELQTLMWDLVGLARDAEGLRETLAKLRTWSPAPEKHRLFTDWEDANLLLLAEAVTMAALAREESRGAHYRLDFEDTIESMARPITVRKV